MKSYELNNLKLIYLYLSNLMLNLKINKQFNQSEIISKKAQNF